MARRHMLIKGVTGTGKTFFILSLIFQAIINGWHSLCVVDPVGTLHKKSTEFFGYLLFQLNLMARTPYPAFNAQVRRFRDQLMDRIVIVDFAEEDIGGVYYNPIEKKHGLSASELAAQFLKVFERASAGDMNMQMRRQLMLTSALALVSEAGGTVCDAHLLLMKDDEEVRPFIERLVNRAEAEGRSMRLEFVRDFMEQFFAALDGRQRTDWVASSWTAFGPFLNNERIYRFLSAPKGNIDFDEICNEGKYLFVHLPRGLGLNTQSFAGSLLIERIKTVCMRRTPEQVGDDVALFVDEVHLLFDQEWATDISTVRNYGLNCFLAHQTDGQFITDDGGEQLLEALTQNCGVNVMFQLGIEDALRASYRVFHPRGEMKKPETVETSESEQHSLAFTRTSSVAQAIGKAFARSRGVTFGLSNGMTIGFSESEGISRAVVKSLGISVAQSKNWSSATSESHSVSVVHSTSETDANGTARADATSQSSGTFESDGSTNGTSSGMSTGGSTSYSFNDGQSMRGGAVDAGMIGLGAASSQNAGHSSSSNSVNNKGITDGTNHSVGRSLANAVSNVISSSKSLARSRGKAVGVSKGHTKSKSVGGSETESLSRSISEGLSIIEGICRSVGESVTRSISESSSETETDSETKTVGSSRGVQRGYSHGSSQTRKAPYMSLDEEARVRSYELAELPPRHAYVLTREDGKVTRIRSHDIPVDFSAGPGGAGAVQKLLARVRPQPPELSTRNVFERIEAAEREERLSAINKPKGM